MLKTQGLESAKQLAELRFLSGDIESVDEFTELYEKLLAAALVRQDINLAAAMKKILQKQAGFLIKQLLEEKAKNETIDNIQ